LQRESFPFDPSLTTSPSHGHTLKSSNCDSDAVVITLAIPQQVGVTEDALNTYIGTALAYVPVDALRVGFTNWVRVRDRHGFAGNSQVTPLPQRMVFIKEALKASHVPAQMDRSSFERQAEQWGWDATDLLWEVQIEFPFLTDRIHVLQLRPNYDLTRFRQHLADRGFVESDYEDTIIYSVPLEDGEAWHFSSNLAHHTD
jgi:hypothetical protein